MRQGDLKQRTKDFALRVMRLIRALPDKIDGKVVANQLLRSAMSVAANYRAACRARTRKEFVAKLGIVEEEADETCFWLELIVDGGLLKAPLVKPLLKEANELVAIIVASRKTAASNSTKD